MYLGMDIGTSGVKAVLVNITHIGFRVTITPPPATGWHGVIYADHFQLRK